MISCRSAENILRLEIQSSYHPYSAKQGHQLISVIRMEIIFLTILKSRSKRVPNESETIPSADTAGNLI